MVYSGKCIGGPYDGQMMDHWEKTKALFRPMIVPNMMNMEKSPVIPMTIGEYRLNDYQQWYWWETKEGHALNTLDKLQGART